MQLNLDVIRETAAETASKLGAIANPEVFYRVRRNSKTIELKDFTNVVQKIEAQQLLGSDQISVTRNGVVSPVWTRLDAYYKTTQYFQSSDTKQKGRGKLTPAASIISGIGCLLLIGGVATDTTVSSGDRFSADRTHNIGLIGGKICMLMVGAIFVGSGVVCDQIAQSKD